MGSTFFSNRYNPETGRRRKSRAKTFKTEESAKKYAESKGIKDYELVDIKSGSSKQKKIKIVKK